MKIERHWTGHGWSEVMVPDAEDWAATFEHIPEPSPGERLAAMERYLQARYGGALPEGGPADDQD